MRAKLEQSRSTELQLQLWFRGTDSCGQGLLCEEVHVGWFLRALIVPWRAKCDFTGGMSVRSAPNGCENLNT